MRTSPPFSRNTAFAPSPVGHASRMSSFLLLAALTLSGGCAARHAHAPDAPQAPSQAPSQAASQVVGQVAGQAVSSVQLVQSERSWDGALRIGGQQGQPQVTILRITIPAGARLPLHQHPVINAGVLTRGQLVVVTENGRELRLAAGDPIVEVVNTPHQGFNPGSEPAEIIVFYAGQAGTPLAVKQGQ